MVLGGVADLAVVAGVRIASRIVLPLDLAAVVADGALPRIAATAIGRTAASIAADAPGGIATGRTVDAAGSGLEGVRRSWKATTGGGCAGGWSGETGQRAESELERPPAGGSKGTDQRIESRVVHVMPSLSGPVVRS